MRPNSWPSMRSADHLLRGAHQLLLPAHLHGRRVGGTSPDPRDGEGGSSHLSEFDDPTMHHVTVAESWRLMYQFLDFSIADLRAMIRSLDRRRLDDGGREGRLARRLASRIRPSGEGLRPRVKLQACGIRRPYGLFLEGTAPAGVSPWRGTMGRKWLLRAKTRRKLLKPKRNPENRAPPGSTSFGERPAVRYHAQTCDTRRPRGRTELSKTAAPVWGFSMTISRSTLAAALASALIPLSASAVSLRRPDGGEPSGNRSTRCS